MIGKKNWRNNIRYYEEISSQYIAIIYGKDFYELKDNELHLLLENEGSLYNSVGSDSRYGKTKNYFKYDFSILNGKLFKNHIMFSSFSSFLLRRKKEENGTKRRKNAHASP